MLRIVIHPAEMPFGWRQAAVEAARLSALGHAVEIVDSSPGGPGPAVFPSFHRRITRAPFFSEITMTHCPQCGAPLR